MRQKPNNKERLEILRKGHESLKIDCFDRTSVNQRKGCEMVLQEAKALKNGSITISLRK